MYANGTLPVFDFVFSFSSVEHSGLGKQILSFQQEKYQKFKNAGLVVVGRTRNIQFRSGGRQDSFGVMQDC